MSCMRMLSGLTLLWRPRGQPGLSQAPAHTCSVSCLPLPPLGADREAPGPWVSLRLPSDLSPWTYTGNSVL